MDCVIELQTSRPFTPGSTINGKLLCLFDTPEIIEGIKCSLVGEERTQFNGEDDTEHVGLERFLRDDFEIIQASTFLSGTYKYPFSFELPDGIPSSFQHINGKVVYEIIAEVSRGDGRYYRNIQAIQVFVTVNLNDMVHEISMVPVTYPIEEKIDACWLCYSADLSLSLRIEKDAFLVGETIKVKLDIKSVTGLGIANVVAKLLAHTEFISDEPRRRKFIAVDKIAKKKDEDGQEGNSEKVYSFELEVPTHLNVPSLEKCKLIKRRYSVTAIVNLNGCFDPIMLPAAITLGHISVQERRPIGFTRPREENKEPSIVPTSLNNLAGATVANHLPYPIDDSNFPLPNRHHVMPPLPVVHLPASYSVIPSCPTSMSSSGINRINLAPRAEDEDDVLLPKDITDQLTPPPTYDEAILQ